MEEGFLAEFIENRSGSGSGSGSGFYINFAFFP